MTVFNDGENPTYPKRNPISIIQNRDSRSLIAYKTGCYRRHLRLQQVESQSSLGSWL